MCASLSCCASLVLPALQGQLHLLQSDLVALSLWYISWIDLCPFPPLVLFCSSSQTQADSFATSKPCQEVDPPKHQGLIRICKWWVFFEPTMGLLAQMHIWGSWSLRSIMETVRKLGQGLLCPHHLTQHVHHSRWLLFCVLY